MNESNSYELMNLSVRKPPSEDAPLLITPSTTIKRNVSLLWKHIKLLIRKNFTIMRRNWKVTLFQLISPILVCLMILFWQTIANHVTDLNEVEPPLKNAIKLPRCVGSENNIDDCITVGYGIVGPKEPWIDYVMEFVAADNGLIMGKDIKRIPANIPTDFNDYLAKNLNKTQIGILFCTEQWELSPGYNLPCKFEQLVGQKLIFYSIVYNNSLLFKSPYFSTWKASYPKDDIAFALKVSVDNALISYFAKDAKTLNSSIKLDPLDVFQARLSDIELQEYPKVMSRFYQGYDVAAQYGAFYYFIPYMITFICSITELMREKDKRLRQGLSVMGLSSTAFWLSWFLTLLILNFVVTLVLMLCGVIFGFDFFLKTPFLIVFGVLLIFGISIQLLGFFLTTVCIDAKNGYTVSYGFLLMAIVMEMFFSNIYIVYFLYQDNLELIFKIIRSVFYIYPAFHYSKIYGDIALMSTRHFSIREGRWIEIRICLELRFPYPYFIKNKY